LEPAAPEGDCDLEKLEKGKDGRGTAAPPPAISFTNGRGTAAPPPAISLRMVAGPQRRRQRSRYEWTAAPPPAISFAISKKEKIVTSRAAFLFQVRSRHVGPRLSFLFQVESEMAGRGAETGPNVDQVGSWTAAPRPAISFSISNRNDGRDLMMAG
jgi:hypothetical protein